MSGYCRGVPVATTRGMDPVNRNWESNCREHEERNMTQRASLGRREFLRSSAAVGGLASAARALGVGQRRSRLRIGVAGLKHYHVYTFYNSVQSPRGQHRRTGRRRSAKQERVRAALRKTSSLFEASRTARIRRSRRPGRACEEFGRRGEVGILPALRAGKHVFCDKTLLHARLNSSNASPPLRLKGIWRSTSISLTP